jgi:hypothetical protein
MDKSIYDLVYKLPTQVEKDRLDMYRSLLESIMKAQGDSIALGNKVIKGMTVIELIDTLAPTNIRFVYDNKTPRY